MFNKPSVLAVAVAAASLFSAGVQASGFKINEQSASGAGRAFAGSAAVANDASVVFFNPAGMSRLERSQASFGFTYLQLEGSFEGVRTNPTGLVTSDTAEAGVYNDGGDFMPDKVIPFGYIVHKLDDKAAVGLGIFAPFGTATDYKSGSLAGGFADETQLSAIDIQPTFSYQLSDTLSFGVGIDIVYAQGLLSKELDLIPYGAPGATDPQYKGYENKFEVKGDDIGYGWNFGVMWDASQSTTLGFAYRSEIDFDLEGKSEFKQSNGVEVYNADLKGHPLLDPDDNGIVLADAAIAAATGSYNPANTYTGKVDKQDSRVPLTGPRSATFSIAHKLDDRLQLLAGATWTDWSSFKYFDVIATKSGIIDDLSGLGENYVGHIVEKWHDTWSYSVGAEYSLNQDWTLRTGYAFDASPVKDEHRTARVPDNDRQWLTAGATYNLNDSWSFDAAVAYLFIDKSKIDEYNYDLDDEQKGADNLKGEFDVNALGLSFQANYRM
ncbi:OmpP1/FadL family transporter [Thalassolituus alkanivorans]|uniref:OmpP1/FadL family transporter n=1 Tax=Thalassolituus alkanivorans TaxID=2881055 RepID=UPI001E5794A6|nr:porin [Thalassolituus alkanivorans]MCB2386551.1 outer membrane protein transport protein [Thalassolituus alkanivorans]MCB2422908.1 outer membrane protein transport protein [Thalassolituus alkanivorans]